MCQWAVAIEHRTTLTSPSSRRSLKLLLLILRFGELGKQKTQLVNEYSRSIAYEANCAMMTAMGPAT